MCSLLSVSVFCNCDLWTWTMDILPSDDIFRELQAIHDTGYFSMQPSLDDHWQQVNINCDFGDTAITSIPLRYEISWLCTFMSSAFKCLRAGVSVCRRTGSGSVLSIEQKGVVVRRCQSSVHYGCSFAFFSPNDMVLLWFYSVSIIACLLLKLRYCFIGTNNTSR